MKDVLKKGVFIFIKLYTSYFCAMCQLSLKKKLFGIWLIVIVNIIPHFVMGLLKEIIFVYDIVFGNRGSSQINAKTNIVQLNILVIVVLSYVC